MVPSRPPTGGPDAGDDSAVDDPHLRAVLDATVDAAFPGDRVTDVRVVPSEGPHSVLSVATEGSGRFALKCAPGTDDTTDLAREVAVTTHVRRQTDTPVAAVVDVDLDPAGGWAPYFVTRWIVGVKLRDAVGATPHPVQLQMFRNLGATLASLHAGTSFDDSGAVEPLGSESFEVRPSPSWPEHFAVELADHVEALDGTRFEHLAEEVWGSMIDRLPRLDAGDRAVLLHGDVGDGNVVYDGTAVSGLLDWERAFVGHPEYDLCRAEVRYFWSQWGESDALQSMLHAGYRSERPLDEGFEDRRPVYLATFYLMSLRNFEAWGPRFSNDLDSFAGRVAEKVRSVGEL